MNIEEDAFLILIGFFVLLPTFFGLGCLLASSIPENTTEKKNLLLRLTAMATAALASGCFSLGLSLLVLYRYNKVLHVNKTVAVVLSVVGSILVVLTFVIGVAIKIRQKKKKAAIIDSENPL